MTLTQQEAQHIIRKLGESGIPPTHGLEAYTVGMDSLLGTLESEYLKGYLRDGGSSFKLVVGEYGSGKSHFLFRLRDIAWENGYVVSRTELSPKECPYDNQLKVYQAVINNLIYHDPDPNIADTQGIEAFLENHFFHTMRMLGIEQMVTSIGLDVRVKMWLETILRFKVESPSYRHAVYFYLQAAAEENEAKKRVIGGWLRGESVALKDVREFSISERIDRSVAFKMLRSLAQLIHELGYAGLALLFDEGDRMVSIGSSRTEKVACDNLREVIDRCAGESLPATLFAYAVPPYFVTNADQYCYLLSGWSWIAAQAGYAGLAVLLDESEHYSLLNIRGQERADNFFKGLMYTSLSARPDCKINEAQLTHHHSKAHPFRFADHSHLLVMFAVTPSASTFDYRRWLDNDQIIALSAHLSPQAADELMTRLQSLHQQAYGSGSEHGNNTSAISRSLLECLDGKLINLRQMIRLAIEIYDLNYAYPDYSAEQAVTELRRAMLGR